MAERGGTVACVFAVVLPIELAGPLGAGRPVFLVAPDLVLPWSERPGDGGYPWADAVAPGRPPRPPNQVGPNQQRHDE